MKQSKINAFFPLILFVLLYFASSLYFADFYKTPMLVILLLSVLVAFLQYRKVPFSEKITAFSYGAGDENILLMVLIFLLAGAFGQLGKEMGAIQSAIDITLHYISPRWVVSGLFLLACLLSLSLGTSVGTIAALAPLAVELNKQIHLDIALVLAAVVGGSMFGDNLSFVSDTTIAATRTQGVGMKEKFKINFRLVLPAAIITFFAYYFITPDAVTYTKTEIYWFEGIKVIPYLFVFGLALVGLNVIWTLGIGIVATIIIGIIFKSIDYTSGITSIQTGISSMFDLSMICILIGGLIGILRFHGGIEYLLHHVSQKINSRKKAELTISFLTGLVNSALANNTLAILLVGPLAKEIVQKNDVDPARSASILDTTSCFVQGIIPYGAQLLTAITISNYTTSPIAVIVYLFYPFLTGISTILNIIFKKNKKFIKYPTNSIE